MVGVNHSVRGSLFVVTFSATVAFCHHTNAETRRAPSPADTAGETRSLWAIIWGCITVIIACTWIAVHPNIPAASDGDFIILCRRLYIMFWTIVAPELTLLWAMSQKEAARVSYYSDSKVHAFFLIMGGYSLYESPHRPPRPLSPEEFSDLVSSGAIDVPNITKQEINDRSKGDAFTKTIVVVQTSWFIIQCAARGFADGLSLTALEVSTLAFAMLNGFMYLFWWSKPLDVRVPIVIHLKPPSHAQEHHHEHHHNSHHDHHEHHQQQPSPPVIPVIYSEPKTPGLLTLLLKALFYPFILTARIIVNITACTTIPPHAKRVPTFYAPMIPDTDNIAFFMIMMVLGSAFGALHFIAWNIDFPSPLEKRLWHVASIFIVAFPIPMCVMYAFARALGKEREFGVLHVAVMGFLIPLYVVARLILIGISFSSLRGLPDSAFYDIPWTTFIPHV